MLLKAVGHGLSGRGFSTPSQGRSLPLSSTNSALEKVRRKPRRRMVKRMDWKPGQSHPRRTPQHPELLVP